MKKILISVLASLAFCVGATAQTLSVTGDVEALSSGETVSLNLHIAEAESMTSIHFELALPESCTLSVRATSAWDAMYTSNGGNVSAISTSSNAFSGEGDIATLQITVSAGTDIGIYPVTINNIRVNGVELQTTLSFNVNVVTAHTIILDEDSPDGPPNDASGVNVKVLRTINANEWSTICLPFAMSAEQIADAFPETEVQLGDFNDYEMSDDEESINVMFINATAIEANHPYIIKVSNPVTEFVVEGVDINPQIAEIDFDTDRRHRFPRKMVGTYVADTELEWGTLFLSGNKFWYSVGNTTMKAYRAYFNFYDLIANFVDNYEARVSMTFDDGTTTEISDASRLNDKGQMINDEVREVYDLQGRKVNPQLRSGVYVKNGKKIVIK